MTWRRWRRALAYRSSRPAIACPRCSGRVRAACRSSSSASIRRATCRSASRRRGFRSRAMADRVRAGWCTLPSRSRARCRCRSRNCPTATAYLCFARTVTRPARALGRPAADACRGDGLQRRARRGRGLCGRAGPGAGEGRHRPVVPPVRSPRLPQPRLSAAGASAGARSADRGRRAIPVRDATRVRWSRCTT